LRKSGWLTLVRLEVTAFETTEALLFSGCTDDGELLDQEACEKLISARFAYPRAASTATIASAARPIRRPVMSSNPPRPAASPKSIFISGVEARQILGCRPGRRPAARSVF